MKRRREFIKNAALSTLGISLFSKDFLLGSFSNKKLSKVEFAGFPGKSNELIVLNDRPINLETPAHLLDDDLTKNELFFVRNNGLIPQVLDAKNWKLSISGESVLCSKSYSLYDLKNKFENVSYNLTIECGGNGRKEFNPSAKGNQWSTGAVGCAKWTGVRLKDVLADVGVKSSAVYIGYYGADIHLSGSEKKDPISRGVPVEKAMEEESLIAWAMNDDDLPILNGYPLRLVFGGFPASCSGKWLERIVVRNKVHDGMKMGGNSYRVPCKPIPPGAKVQEADMCIIEKMPVKSLISSPKTGAIIGLNESLPISGKSWTSAKNIVKVDYSIDFGVTWHECKLASSKNRYAWQSFYATIGFPDKGYYEVWARATDSEGKSQPMVLPGWNPKGYLNNACHRIAIKVI